MIEARVHFDLRISELDQAARGSRALDLDAAEAAARLMARFENNLILHGFGSGAATGIAAIEELPPVRIRECEPAGILEAVSHALLQLRDAGVDGPYDFLTGPDLFKTLTSISSGYPLGVQVERLIGGKVVHCGELSGGILVSRRGGDLELTLGQDLSVGYERHGVETVRLYIVESVTFQVLDGAAVVQLASGGDP
jgi:uncharacterized linocin/CFP29 family protein